MSHSIQLPDDLYARLEQAATAAGSTPVEWIASQLKQEVAPSSQKSLAERFAGRTGKIASGGHEALSQECGKKFADHLEEKRNAGHL